MDEIGLAELAATPRDDVQRVLELCACPELGDEAATQLMAFRDHDLHGLADRAEQERLTPLAFAHLSTLAFTQAELKRMAAYALRQQHRGAKLQEALEAVAAVLHDMPVLTLKGAALAPLLYGGFAGRQMDDIDVWVHPDMAHEARKKLLAAGFTEPENYIPASHDHHLPTVYRGEIPVEIHTYFLGGGHSDTWDEVFPRAVPVAGWGNLYRPATADCIWQVWHHAFRNSLRWAPWRLYAVADLHGLLHADDVDWDIVGRWKGLAVLHQLSPLSGEVLQKLGGLGKTYARVGEKYTAWPVYGGSRRAALAPSPWWLKLRHGIMGQALWRCCLSHLRDLIGEYRDPKMGPMYSPRGWMP